MLTKRFTKFFEMTEDVQKSPSADFSLYPLFWLAICFAGGIVAANFLRFDWISYLIICLSAMISAVVFYKSKFVLAFIFAAFAALGGFYFQISNQPSAANRLKNLYDTNQIKSGAPIQIEGVVQSNPETAVGGFFITLQAAKAIYQDESFDVAGKIRLYVVGENGQNSDESEQPNLKYDTKIRVNCVLRREDNFLNPGVVSRKQLLDQTGLDAGGFVKSPAQIEIIGAAENFSVRGWIYAGRQSLIDRFNRRFSVATRGVLDASLLGNKNFLDKPTAEIFREGGTFHVLVISGLHITFIGGLTLLFVQFFTNKRLWQFIAATAFLWTYAIAVGAETPVLRATIMFTVLLFSQAIYRRGTLLNSFGLCAFVLLGWQPNDIFTASFQLTFVSVGAIILTAFPLIEKLRAVGSWSPTADAPFPPDVPAWLKRFCETIYWRENVWNRAVKRQIWSANLFKSPYLKWLETKNLKNPARYFFEATLVSFVVQIWLLPVTVIYFHRVTFVSVLTNLWVGIILALESFAALFAVALGEISDAAALPFIKLTEILNWLLVAVLQFFTDGDWASFRLPTYSGAAKAIYFLYFLPLIVLIVALNRWKPFELKRRSVNSKHKNLTAPLLRFCAGLLAVFFVLIVFHPFSAPRSDGRLHIDFLDVGQGDSALVTFPDGETLLIDGGGKINFNRVYVPNENGGETELFVPDAPNVGEAVVSNFLWAKGYSNIDYILATHADADHIQGLNDVAKNFRVRAAIFGRTPLKNYNFAALYEILQKRGTEILTVSRGDVLTFGDVRVEVLYPKKAQTIEDVSDNNSSLTLRLIFGNRKFLLTGDIEKEAERYLLNAPELLQTDVIKVAHHGSRTSSTAAFVDASRAKLAIISVGRESQFGHPHKEVVERWLDSGAKVLTTGERGTISVSTDGRDLQFKTFLR